MFIVFFLNHLQLYNEFTLPLLQVVIEMENKEKKLLEIIEEKTLQLEECKQEKSKLLLGKCLTKFSSIYNNNFFLFFKVL